MSIIRFPIRFEGSLGERILYALFDSGASYSGIHPDLASELGHVEKLPRPMTFATASAGHFLEVTETIRCEFYLDELRLSDEFLIIPDLSEEVIIGVNTLQKWKIKLDFEVERPIIEARIAKMILNPRL